MSISGRIRASLARKSAGNRMFFDALCLLIWCECKAGNTTKSRSWEEWADIELPYFGTSRGAGVDEELPQAFNTPRRVLTRAELDAVQSFIDGHTFVWAEDARAALADGIFTGCMASALGALNPACYKNGGKSAPECHKNGGKDD